MDASEAKAAGLAKIREGDPSALAPWSVKGPKELPGSITAVLANREIVILHAFAGGSKVYAEQTAPAADDGE